MTAYFASLLCLVVPCYCRRKRIGCIHQKRACLLVCRQDNYAWNPNKHARALISIRKKVFWSRVGQTRFSEWVHSQDSHFKLISLVSPYLVVIDRRYNVSHTPSCSWTNNHWPWQFLWQLDWGEYKKKTTLTLYKFPELNHWPNPRNSLTVKSNDVQKQGIQLWVHNACNQPFIATKVLLTCTVHPEMNSLIFVLLQSDRVTCAAKNTQGTFPICIWTEQAT